MKRNYSIQKLADYLPNGSYELVVQWFEKFPVHLQITKPRSRILGNYRNPVPPEVVHLITINRDLNPYSFLVTLLHELAHMVTYIQYQHRVKSHGVEWKANFSNILKDYIGKSILPTDIELALVQSIDDIKASTCGNEVLYKALAKYDDNNLGLIHANEMIVGDRFVTKNNLVFKILSFKRTRLLCLNLMDNKQYLVPGIMLVKRID